MVNRSTCVDYHRGLVLVAILTFLSAPEAVAGLYTMEQSLPDFSFDDASIVYGPQSHIPDAERRIAAESAPEGLNSMAPTVQAYGKGDGLRGIMVLDVDKRIDEDLVRGPFNVFGSLPSATSRPGVKLLTDTLDTMEQSHQSSGDETFFTQGDRMKGSLANKYRGYGIYFSVGGLDEVMWIREMSKAITKGGGIFDSTSR